MAKEKATVNHVVVVNGQPVFSCDDTDEQAEMKCGAVAADHLCRCIASGAKQDVKIVSNRIRGEKADAA